MDTQLTPAELDVLLEAAKAADTKGEWRAINSPAEIELTLDRYLNARSLRVAAPACSSRYGLIPQGVVSANDARFIAAANPATITRLVLMVRELQEHYELCNQVQKRGEHSSLTCACVVAVEEVIQRDSIEHFRARAVKAIKGEGLARYLSNADHFAHLIESLPLVETEDDNAV